MKKIAGMLRLDLAQYRELEAFAQFGSDLDAATQRQLARGERIVEMLKQGQYVPLPVEKQVLIIFAATHKEGFVMGLAPSLLGRFEEELFDFFEARHPDLIARIRDENGISEDLEKALVSAIRDFMGVFKA